MRFRNFFLSQKTVAAAGLTIYKGIFRYIALEQQNDDSYLVSNALADHVNDSLPYSRVFEKLAAFSKERSNLSVSLPISETMVKVLYLPMNFEDAKKSLRYELEKFFPISSSEAVFDIAEVDFPFDDQYEGSHYLVAVAKKSSVNELLDAAKRYGFKVECIEPAQIALERAVSAFARQTPTVFVYMGSRYIQYILFWNNNGICYRASDLNNYEVPDSLNADEMKDIKIVNFARELQLFLEDSYSDTKISAKSVVMFGPSATRELCIQMEEKFPVKFDCINIMELNGIEMEDADNVEGYWDIPIGLALRHFDGS